MDNRAHNQPDICSTPLDFAAIQALSDDALNTLIDRHCTTHQWMPDARNGYAYYKLEHPDIGLGRMWSTVRHRHYTRSWERLMPLCCRAGVRLRHHRETWVISDGAGVYRLEAHTEADARRRIGELVLWEVARAQEDLAAPPALLAQCGTTLALVPQEPPHATP